MVEITAHVYMCPWKLQIWMVKACSVAGKNLDLNQWKQIWKVYGVGNDMWFYIICLFPMNYNASEWTKYVCTLACLMERGYSCMTMKLNNRVTWRHEIWQYFWKCINLHKSFLKNSKKMKLWFLGIFFYFHHFLIFFHIWSCLAVSFSMNLLPKLEKYFKNCLKKGFRPKMEGGRWLLWQSRTDKICKYCFQAPHK